VCVCGGVCVRERESCMIFCSVKTSCMYNFMIALDIVKRVCFQLCVLL